MKKISVIAIGTEVTSGQITNTNAQSISKKITDLGFLCTQHISVPDERTLILNALEFAFDNSDIVFTIGGLGPTVDDFTRDVVAEFLNLPLEYHKPTHDRLIQKLGSRQVPVREGHLRECYFPKGSQVLENFEGTADGFLAKANSKIVITLPGPPKEIDSIWKSSLNRIFQDLLVDTDILRTFKLSVMGLPESEIAHRLDERFQKLNQKVDLAYRIHLPYIEVKYSYLEEPAQATHHELIINEIKKEFENEFHFTGSETPFEKFFSKLSQFSEIEIIDSFSQGYFLNKLIKIDKNILAHANFTYSTQKLEQSSQNLNKLVFSLTSATDNKSVQVELIAHGKNDKQILTWNDAKRPNNPRLKLYLTELAVLWGLGLV